VPAGLVAHMRERLGWDVLFVLEEKELRRATDLKHFRLAGQLRRTLVTLDRDYLDDRIFPPSEGSGVLVLSAPNEREFRELLGRMDRVLFKGDTDHADTRSPLPLDGRKLHAHTDWGRSLDG
jgi:hypothetical protein